MKYKKVFPELCDGIEIKKDMCDEFVGLKKNNLFVTNMINNTFKLEDFFNKKSIKSFEVYKKHIRTKENIWKQNENNKI